MNGFGWSSITKLEPLNWMQCKVKANRNKKPNQTNIEHWFQIIWEIGSRYAELRAKFIWGNKCSRRENLALIRE